VRPMDSLRVAELAQSATNCPPDELVLVRVLDDLAEAAVVVHPEPRRWTEVGLDPGARDAYEDQRDDDRGRDGHAHQKQCIRQWKFSHVIPHLDLQGRQVCRYVQAQRLRSANSLPMLSSLELSRLPVAESVSRRRPRRSSRPKVNP
jgi:hypothetical protein